MKPGIVRVGIGGWNFPPWRGTFYPAGLPQARELEYASRQVTSIEINATFYGSQKPESFRRWAETAPDGFVFSVKAPRFATHRRELGEAGSSIERFLNSGIVELGDKLGPILWQFPPTRQFDAAAFERFLALLPKTHAGHTLRHVIEARHPSLAVPEFFALLRRFGVAAAIVASDKHVLRGDLTADFVYARLEHNDDDQPEGYDPAELDSWVARCACWAGGKPVDDLALAGAPAAAGRRDCFIYFISGDKQRAPAAAQAMLRRLAA